MLFNANNLFKTSMGTIGDFGGITYVLNTRALQDRSFWEVWDGGVLEGTYTQLLGGKYPGWAQCTPRRFTTCCSLTRSCGRKPPRATAASRSFSTGGGSRERRCRPDLDTVPVLSLQAWCYHSFSPFPFVLGHWKVLFG